MRKPTGRRSGRPNSWTPEMIEKLRANASTMTYYELADLLGRSHNAVRAKAKEHKLQTKRAAYRDGRSAYVAEQNLCRSGGLDHMMDLVDKLYLARKRAA